MGKKVRLRFDGKDIMFDAFAEMIADNGNYTWGDKDDFVVCFIKGVPCYIYLSVGKYECFVTFGCIFVTDEVCKLVENQLNNNEDGYIYHCQRDIVIPERMVITATTIIDE